MNRWREATGNVRSGFETITNWMFGCSHRRTSFPITLRSTEASVRQQNAQSETYCVCLDCGHHIAYNWGTMRAQAQRLSHSVDRSRVPNDFEDTRDSKADRYFAQTVD